MGDYINHEDGSPVSFVSKKTLAAKDQKAHLKYLKKKKNKINNATQQSEMPVANQIGVSEENIRDIVEAVTSHLSTNYKSKGHMDFCDLKEIPLCKNTILSYKKDKYCKFLSHIRYGDNIDGCIFLDRTIGKTHSVVGVIAVETKNNGRKWIQALEITKPYQGYGLSKAFVNYAMIHYGARYLSVNKKNEIAIKVYEDCGFEKYYEDEYMIYMKYAYKRPLLDQILLGEQVSLLEAVKRDMIPIFIVNSWTNTLGGKVIRTVTKSTYTHSAISLDTSLTKLYSFNADNKLNKFGGVSLESIDEYIKVYDKCLINVKCLFVKPSDYQVIKNVMDYMVTHQDKTTYDYLDLFNILFGRAKEMTDKAMSMVCSQFVSYALSRAEIDLIGKAPNLTTPKDLVMTSNPKVYLLYEGLAKEYDKKKIDRIFRKLKQKAVLIKECSL